MAEKKQQPVEFTPPRSVAAEGMRIGLVSCHKCGAALVFDPGDEINVSARHKEWHAAIEQEGEG